MIDTPEGALPILAGQTALPGAVPACPRCGQALPIRLCVECGASLNDRGPQARRCTDCAQARRRHREAARQRAYRNA